ncbi:resolvase [Fervidicella metallireducens AeB]|uniref:Resolvase n=1 Tax=Fervidicella metallireducens AeB TaxID=1403537 RepID=A0A017RRG8_9CLOT|nr:recombinase family protein [Fervidicella metallireducens]EYE87186.1 resolvase [Fervidicella metallireducens AeB]
MRIGYIRVSSIDQNEARQIEGLKDYNLEKVFIEKISAKDTNRPEFKKMLEFSREGDTIYILDFSRLARNTKDLLDTVESLTKKGIHLVSKKENLDTSTPTGKLILTIIGAINEFERTNTLERQREGIAIAKKAGKYKGRKPILIEDFESYYDEYKNRRINKTQLARQLKVSRPTLDKIIKEYENQPGE